MRKILGFNLFEASTIYVEQADPLVFLLEIAHNVAICALDKLGDRCQEHLISVDCGRQEAAIILSTFIPQPGQGLHGRRPGQGLMPIKKG